MNNTELAARLLGSFLDELDEQLIVLNAELLSLENEKPTGERLRGLFRIAHTLKGAARAANVPLVERVCHELETHLAAGRSGDLVLGPAQFAMMFAAADALADAGRRLRAGESLEGSSLAAIAADLKQLPQARQPEQAPAVEARAPRPAAREGAGDGLAPAAPPAAAAGEPRPVDSSDEAAPKPSRPSPAGPRAEGSVRVDADKLDGLLASVGTLSLSRERSVVEAGELMSLEAEMARWTRPWRRRARHVRRHLEGEASGEAAELLEEAEQWLDRLSRRVGHVATATGRQERALQQAVDDVGDQVRLLRLRPFSDVTEALPRVVRDVATALGRNVHLELRGTTVEADRGVLDGIREPLLHLVRNAVDHGIEPESVRTSQGKPAQGTIVVAAAVHGDRLIVTVSDDGSGIDEAELRDQLARAGRAVSGGERELARAMLQGGVSTRSEATAISGRGVGLDLARAGVERLGGTVDVSWTAGQGTTFTLDSPIALSRIRAVVVRIGSQLLAIPASHIERLQRLQWADVRRVTGRDVMVSVAAASTQPRQGAAAEPTAPIRVVSLASLLGPPFVEKPPADPMPVVVVGASGALLALVVDEMVSEQELIAQPLPAGYRVSRHASGASLLPGGGVTLVMNVPSLVAAGLAWSGSGVGSRAAGRPARRRILVADDSLTTRTLEQSVLEAAGYDVITAVDGADAWRLLEEQECDLVVSDVEMPRMDGFALCEAIRGNRRLARLPVVLVTAQEAPEHRARGLEAGADAYIGKSGFDQQDLLKVVHDLLAS